MFLLNFRIISIVIGIIIIVICMIGITSIIMLNRRNSTMYLKVYNTLDEFSKDKEIKLSKIKNYGFDYLLEDKTSKTYIKVVSNFNCYELLVNSEIKWQLKKNPNDDSIFMVEEVEGPILHDFSYETKKVNKIFVIYPNSRLLMMATNECEYEFIYPTTLVHGYRVINYLELDFQIKMKNFEL